MAAYLQMVDFNVLPNASESLWLEHLPFSSSKEISKCIWNHHRKSYRFSTFGCWLNIYLHSLSLTWFFCKTFKMKGGWRKSYHKVKEVKCWCPLPTPPPPPFSLLHTCRFKSDNMFGKQLIHLEHISAICFKDHTQGIITDYLSFVTWILQIILPNVCPKLLHNLDRDKSADISKPIQ